MRLIFRIVKAFLVVLGVAVIVSVVASFVTGTPWISLIGGNFGNGSNGVVSENDYDKVKRLEVNVKTTNVVVKEVSDGEALKMSTNNEYVESWTENGTLHVVEKSHGVLGWGGTGELTVYVRKGVELDTVKLEVGAGMLKVEALDVKDLELSLGAGKTEIAELTVGASAEIKGGAGLLTIGGGEARNLTLELGAGKAEIALKLSGSNKVKTGVGKLDLALVGEEEDYRLTVKKGLGSVTFNKAELGDGAVQGSGVTLVALEAGMGAVAVQTVREGDRSGSAN